MDLSRLISPDQFILIAIFLLIGFPVHEFCHAYAAYRLGDSTARWQGRLTLDPRVHFDQVGGLLLVVSALSDRSISVEIDRMLPACSAEPDAMPLVITHGWPGSISEFEKINKVLADTGMGAHRGGDRQVTRELGEQRGVQVRVGGDVAEPHPGVDLGRTDRSGPVSFRRRPSR